MPCRELHQRYSLVLCPSTSTSPIRVWLFFKSSCNFGIEITIIPYARPSGMLEEMFPGPPPCVPNHEQAIPADTLGHGIFWASRQQLHRPLVMPAIDAAAFYRIAVVVVA